MKIKAIFEKKQEIKVEIKGWIIFNRGNNNIRFLTINDGSTFTNIQVVLKGEEATKFDGARVGSATVVKGNIKLTPNSQQPLELVATEATLVRNVDEDFPLQRQEMSRETLREIPHLRHRTNLFRAAMRVRSTLAQEIHSFFAQKGFLLAAAPILTGVDGEGAGEMFYVDSPEGNFFNQKATLGVTGQLHAESYANGFGDVYTFAPTFRAENSHTQKHAAEFWMVEPEMAFASKDDGIQLGDDMLKHVIKNTLAKHKEEFAFFEEHVQKGLLDKLNNFVSKGVQKITYSEAIEKLQKVKDRFDIKDIFFGLDLATEHEKYIAEELFNGPVAVTDYPKDIKAFYMKQNEDGKTVAAYDILVPGIGELIGGSERECDYEKLVKRVNEMKISQADMQWYLDLRRFGQIQSTGFGLGFERLVMYVTGIENIRDVIPYPRTAGNMKM